MRESVKNTEHTPDGYGPKTKPEIFSLLQSYGKKTFSEKIALLPKGSGTPPTRNKISSIHRLYHADKGENFMFAGCLRGVFEALGEDRKIYDYNLMMALCGDLFTQMYSKSGESDCLMDNCFIPEMAIHAFRMCGYESVFFTAEEIAAHPGAVMDAVRQSIGRGVPVITIGAANIPVAKQDGEKAWNGTTPIVGRRVEVPFASLIGGYEEDKLLVNVWLEEAVTEENGYAAAENALAKSIGLLLVGHKTKAPLLAEVYEGILRTLPAYLTLPEQNGYSFARQAFYQWADHIRSKEILSVDDKWNMHFAPAVILYTNTGRAMQFINRVVELCPAFALARKLQPLFARAVDLQNTLDKLQGGFSFDAARFAEDAFRKAHTDILYRLGDLQDEIVSAFEEEQA